MAEWLERRSHLGASSQLGKVTASTRQAQSSCASSGQPASCWGQGEGCKLGFCLRRPWVTCFTSSLLDCTGELARSTNCCPPPPGPKLLTQNPGLEGAASCDLTGFGGDAEAYSSLRATRRGL